MEHKDDLHNESRPYQKYYITIAKVMKQEMGIDLESHGIDVKYWNYFNEMRDKGIPLNELMETTEMVPEPSIYALESA